MPDTDPQSLNVIGPSLLVKSSTNKVSAGGNGDQEGVSGDFEDVLTLKLSDEELLGLAQQWTTQYQGYEKKIKVRQDKNKQYYLGRQKEGGLGDISDDPIVGNLIFEAEETFLPAALAKNPEPVVYADNTPEGNKIAGDVKTMLQYHADTLVLRRKLQLVTRHWSIYFIGVMKHGWSEEIQDITSEVRDPQNFIFDPHGYIDSYGDYVGPLGERISISAAKLCEKFPEHKAYITVMVNGKMGTEVTYTEWWNDDYCFYTFKDKVLDKHKNQYFNYTTKVPSLDLDGNEEVDELGQPVLVDQEGKNHFAKPKKPYTFLAVYSLGEQPHDITGLIEQNIPNQNLISRRTTQIDYNLSAANNSIALSEANFTQETGKQFAEGRAKGHPLLVPQGGPLGQAFEVIPTQSVPDAFFTDLANSKQTLRSSFGTEGISSQAPTEDTTARGMILNQQFDNTRIGGGIGDALEQFADNVFNAWTQFYYVFYDDKHYATVLGQMKAVEYVELSNADLPRRLVVSVSPDSLKSHDELSEMNQALSLWNNGVNPAIDPKTLLTMLNFPDPQETAEMAVLWNLDKPSYLQLNFPELAQKLAQMAQAGIAGQQVPQGGAGEPGAQLSPLQPPSLSESPASASLSSVSLPQ